MLKTRDGLAVAETGVARCKCSEPACRFFGGHPLRSDGAKPLGTMLDTCHNAAQCLYQGGQCHSLDVYGKPDRQPRRARGGVVGKPQTGKEARSDLCGILAQGDSRLGSGNARVGGWIKPRGLRG